MSKPDSDRLAEALRANLRRRKDRMREQRDSGEAIESFGSDEEGDVPVGDSDRPGSWVRIGSEKD
jgi:hypothetical protein